MADIKTQFFDDLNAAVFAKVPLEIDKSGQSSKRLSTSALLQFKEDLKTDHLQVQSPQRLLAGWQIFQHTDLTPPILDGLSVNPMARKETVQALSWTWRYLALLIATAFAGLCFFAMAVAPEIVEMRLDTLREVSTNSQSLEQLKLEPTWPRFLPVAGITLLLFFLWGCLGGTKQWSLWLGGQEYIRLRCMISALNTAQLLVAAKLPVESAIDLSCKLVGNQDIKSRLSAIRFDDFYSTRATADQWSHLACVQLQNMKFRVPVFAVSILGGVVALIYGTLIFHPITQMLTQIGRTHI